MILGLKGKMKEIHKSLEKIRSGSQEATGQLAGKRDVTLVEYLGANYKEGCGNDGVFDIQHLYNELGINPSKMTVEGLIDLDQDSRWLVPEIFRDAIRKGLRTSPFYNRLVALNETVAQPQVNMPSLDLSDAEPAETGEAETISKGSISYDNKVVTIAKQAIGIEITDEALRYSSLNLVTIFIQDMGIKLGQKLNNAAIDVLINGDQADASEAAAVVGVENTVTGLLYSDILRAWIRASRLGRLYSSIVAGEEVANKILNLNEFKDKQAGTPQQGIVVNELLPSQSQLFVSAQVPANQLILLDPRFALAQLTSAPLSVEGDRIVNKQINGSYASITTGFANIFRDARVLLDHTAALSGNDFPSWMTPTL
jgi:hypothetical protein